MPELVVEEAGAAALEDTAAALDDDAAVEEEAVALVDETRLAPQTLLLELGAPIPFFK